MGDVDAQLWEIEEYPIMFNGEDNLEVYNEVKEDELSWAIKSMKGDKIPGPNGWIAEFFVHFLDIFGEHLL